MLRRSHALAVVAGLYASGILSPGGAQILYSGERFSSCQCLMPKSVANTKAIKPKGAMMASQSDLVQIAASNEEQSLVVLRPKPEAIRAAQAGEIVPGASGRKHRY